MTSLVPDIDPATLRECVASPVVFSATILKEPVWDHQADLMLSPARIKVVKGGRRSGKSSAAAKRGLHKCFAYPITHAGEPAHCLITSAREDEAKRVLAEARRYALRSDLFAGCLENDLKTSLTFENGSVFEAVPRTEASIRGKGLHFVVLDEAFQLGDGIWAAAEGATLDIDDAEIWICSTVGASPTHWWNTYYAKGLGEGSSDDQGLWVKSFHWPSSISPRVSKRVLRKIEEENDPWLFKREYLALDTDDSDAVFGDSLIFGATAHGSRPMSAEESASRRHRVEYWDRAVVEQPVHTVVLGIDPGGSRDPWAFTAVGVVEDRNRGGNSPDEAQSMNEQWIYAVMFSDRLWQPTEEEATRQVVKYCRAWNVPYIVAESSGLGFHWAGALGKRLQDAGVRGTSVFALPTTAESKRRCMSEMAGGMASGQLCLPELGAGYSDLVSELRSMGQSRTDHGNIRLAARTGHDDLVMSLAIAWRLVELRQPRPDGGSLWCDIGEDNRAVIAGGAIVPKLIVPRPGFSAWRAPGSVR
ncbi:MAG: hypothetical protein ACRDPY_28595 [Streptosporangiaceae bacterium]